MPFLLSAIDGNVSRRPGLREQFPRQPVVKREHAHQMGNYPAAAEQLVQLKRPTRRNSSTAKRDAGDSASRSASRALNFEASQHQKPNTRHKRASWSGRYSNAAGAPRRQCKSARKSKDCMIPGCTKGARSRGLCKRHGGGKRCTFPECTRSDQGGGFCIGHGGVGNKASGARPKDARTRPSLEDSARVMEEERDAAPKDAPRAAKQEDFAEATDRLA
ncbi:uncharacterized protein PITG_05524 [Phytophthora infestans T30-4]|uniref:WRKY19-like zinc finger domain-containing protein n=1 Tax=Phytophthora infestans (strain T30-4) TaxID=403677 RepID=D0N313_PHYIT|nr:uncharacterized protein PITG_05524 [Phytophthora infestans T30-4]EEY69305.1 hypothetical protein PITG_05524 [Phytophthora infestans T30-4]|eukprot:XP_002999159.1 hypothetical protein PITG_05524 [Phytophthora infestans T30-4]